MTVSGLTPGGQRRESGQSQPLVTHQVDSGMNLQYLNVWWCVRSTEEGNKSINVSDARGYRTQSRGSRALMHVDIGVNTDVSDSHGQSRESEHHSV